MSDVAAMPMAACRCAACWSMRAMMCWYQRRPRNRIAPTAMARLTRSATTDGTPTAHSTMPGANVAAAAPTAICWSRFTRAPADSAPPPAALGLLGRRLDDGHRRGRRRRLGLRRRGHDWRHDRRHDRLLWRRQRRRRRCRLDVHRRGDGRRRIIRRVFDRHVAFRHVLDGAALDRHRRGGDRRLAVLSTMIAELAFAILAPAAASAAAAAPAAAIAPFAIAPVVGALLAALAFAV